MESASPGDAVVRPRERKLAPSPIYSVELEVFEGPLDLLLHLVRKHELDILDIPIAFTTEKYLEYLDVMRQLDLENVTRDRADRVEEFNALTVALGNRLYQRPGAPGEAAVPLADFVLSGQYDFAQEEFGGIYLDGRLFPFAGATARLGLGFDPEQAQVDEGLAGLAFRDERGDRFSLEYRYLREVPRFFEAFPQENPRFEEF